MLDRFFFDGPWNAEVNLSGQDAHHLGRVLRAQPGQQVELFDGQGTFALATVRSVSKRGVQLQLASAPQKTVRQFPSLTLAVAPPKGERLRWLIEKSTELGVDRLIPLQTERTVVHPGDRKLDKLRQVVIEACKQCRRNWLMQIEELTPLPEFLAECLSNGSRVFVGDQNGQPWADEGGDWNATKQPSVAIVGPEGGLSSEELVSLEEAGAIPISVAPHILRVETAAIAIATLLISREGAG
ncbi:MAG: 16S rRNA (uracil(1498)-N(3))-methyltransferase [Planctomycetaceae bacterium]|nr:16S rRNA (uracil(1498)-N(3))-methyltransferase [Planctomycetaceae bacterium]